MPQVSSDRGLHVRPSQHPSGHEAPSQMHAPSEQRWPDPQAGPLPHAHSPLVEQLSASAVSQGLQVSPAAAQAVADRVWQVLLLQQPLAHEIASQMQLPSAQRWPAAQAAFAAQAQAPLAEQLSARSGSQPTQTRPPLPHAERVGGEVQVAPEQQPPAQLTAVQPLQMPLLQCSGVHDWQAPPPVPHAVSLVPARQTPSRQQPLHDSSSHTQAPSEQRWPALHGACLPHWQVPVAEHESAVVSSQVTQSAPAMPQVARDRSWQMSSEQQPSAQVVALQTQAPATQLWPCWQAAEVPQRHSPEVQLSALVVLQAMQVAPAVPQVVIDEVWQVEPAQHPSGQLVASQMHWPPKQRWPVSQVGPWPHAQSPLALQLSALLASQATQAAPPTPQVVVDWL